MIVSSEVVQRFLNEVWNLGHIDAVSNYISGQYEIDGVGSGPEASAANARTFREAFPDLRLEVVDVVSDGSCVAVWMRLSGTHSGEFRGYPGTGKTATWDEVGFFTVKREKIVEGRFLADMFGPRKQLGVLPKETL